MPFRLVYTEFWTDPKVIEDMTPEDKYFYLYLLTNPNTNMIGVYQITKKQMAFDLGYSIESVNAILDRFTNFHKLVIYDACTREICIKNYGKYNLNKGGKPMLDCIKRDLSKIENQELVQEILKHMEHDKIKDFIQSCLSSNGNNDTCHDTSTSGGTEGGHNHNHNHIQNQNQILIQNHNPKQTNSDSGFAGKVRSNLDIFKYLEKCNFTLSPIMMEKIAADIGLFGANEVMKAAEIADGNGKRNYHYLRGILDRRRAEGTDNRKGGLKNGTTSDEYGEQLKDMGIGL